MLIKRLGNAPIARTGASPAARFVIVTIATLHYVARSIPKIGDAVEVTAKVRVGIIDFCSWIEIISPGIPIHTCCD